jgi:hypothetical protein
MKIIGLTGKAGAGKDTAAQFALDWCKRNGFAAERLAFADPLKVSASRALGFQGASWLGSPEETAECVAFCNELKQTGTDIQVIRRGPDSCELEHSLSGREYLQFFGTEGHRDVFGQEFWVEVTERKLAEMAWAVDVVFITDTRFENEAQMVHHHEGEVWEIVRPELESSSDTHASEAGLSDDAIEFQLINSGDLADLQSLVELACEANL